MKRRAARERPRLSRASISKTIEPPEPPPTISEKPATRKLLAQLMTGLVIGLFVCVAFQYLYRDSDIDRQDFMHLTELLLVLYGTILGFYFGSQE
jgi:hypothetical protein